MFGRPLGYYKAVIERGSQIWLCLFTWLKEKGFPDITKSTNYRKGKRKINTFFTKVENKKVKYNCIDLQ